MDTGSGYDLALTGTGPGQIDARLTGRLAPDLSQASLALTGSAQAGLANPFLGKSRGVRPGGDQSAAERPLALSALSGSLQLTNGRLADPGLPFLAGTDHGRGHAGIRPRASDAGHGRVIRRAGQPVGAGFPDRTLYRRPDGHARLCGAA